ncbi:MAG: SUMF1/EgtB/PvdO family nonheme iron enzyme [Planctomycetaceae bacterium]|nr:SUMF1/EgtB/PvdO family nonheme iron enzyme [Planctomycetaceae bacterium]
MTIPIIHEDDVDQEPLIIRFVNGRKLSQSKADRIARFVRCWMDQAAENDPDLWSMAKEWDCTVSENCDVIARCEFFPEPELSRLSADIHQEFPTLIEMRLGYPLSNPTTVQKFDWYKVPDGSVVINRKVHNVTAFDISFTPVTIGQFEEFVDATHYTPVPDLIEKIPGFLVDNFKLQYGSNSKHVLHGVTHDDAVAFCTWANLRLPTDAELKHFFESACMNNMKFKRIGVCWTSTRSGNEKYVARNGPYLKDYMNGPEADYRILLPKHLYEFPENPCFRVVRIG